MAKTFKTDAAGKALIKEFEKCELETYFDATSGNPVIGWGQENWLFPNTPGAIRVVPGLKITQQQADDAFEFFIHNVTDPLVWKHFNCETQSEHNACAAWVYNIRTSKLERGEYSLPGIFNKRPRDPQEIVDWWIKYRNPKTNTEQGLYRRRLAELSHMDSAPHKFAWMAKLRRAGEPGNRFGGPIVEMTDANYILDLARAAKPIASLPDPPKPAKPVVPVKVEPLPEVKPEPQVGTKPISPKTVKPEDVPYKIDPNAGLKPLEESERAIGYFWQNLARLFLRLTGLGTFGTAAAGVANVVQSDAVLGSALLDLTIPLLVFLTGIVIAFVAKQYGDWRRKRGEESASQGMY
jgi:GH24 family phage-related lysozyme (muramidase)